MSTPKTTLRRRFVIAALALSIPAVGLPVNSTQALAAPPSSSRAAHHGLRGYDGEALFRGLFLNEGGGPGAS